MEEYLLCTEINGQCKCQMVGARPCASITDLVENEMRAQDELDRMDQEREDAAT